MNRDNEFDPRLERALEEIRGEQIDPTVIETAAARVWTRLEGMQHAPLRTCADYQALIPDYRAGRLPEARALLLKDHTHECMVCWKALKGTGAPTAPRRLTRPLFARPSLRWAVAAAVTVAVGLTAWSVLDRLRTPSGSAMTVQAASGLLYQVSGQDMKRFTAGQQIQNGELRTAKDADAVIRLRDGSLVEMRDRSGLSISGSGRDLTIHLDQGSIIVQAAKRRTGHLYVATRDCKVAVTGTVFSVSSGVKGSRVSVIEGEVHVTQGKEAEVLHSGDQFSSSATMTPVSVREDIAWSRNLDAHLALLREFSVLRKQLKAVHLPELRYSSRLLNRLPADTLVYAAIPNLGQTLAEAQQIFQQRAQESPVLHEWYENAGPQVDKILDEVKRISDYLGDEIVMTVPASAVGKTEGPVFVAELKRSGFREFVQSELNRLGSAERAVRIVDNLTTAVPSQGQVLMLIRPDLVAMSPSVMALRQVVTALDGNGAGFAATPFGSQVADTYRNGVSFVLSADLRRLTPEAQRETAAHPNLGNVQYLIVTQQQSPGATETRATLSFHGGRAGIASWLASPAPIGALDFMTPEAGFVAGFAMKSPADILQQLESLKKAVNPKSGQITSDPGSQEVRDLGKDLIASLGGEFAVGLDGPAFPVPSWKLAVEVYDPSRLQSTIQRLVELFNSGAAHNGKPAIQFTQETASGRTYYTLTIPEARPFTEAHYVFVDGYLLAAPNRALLERAIQSRTNGYTLARSAAFTSLLPRDHYANFSGVVYSNLGPTIGSLVAGLGATNAITPQQRQSVDSLKDEMKPTLVTIYGEADRITLASTGSMFGLTVSNLVGMPGPMGLVGLLGGHNHGTPARQHTYR